MDGYQSSSFPKEEVIESSVDAPAQESGVYVDRPETKDTSDVPESSVDEKPNEVYGVDDHDEDSLQKMKSNLDMFDAQIRDSRRSSSSSSISSASAVASSKSDDRRLDEDFDISGSKETSPIQDTFDSVDDASLEVRADDKSTSQWVGTAPSAPVAETTFTEPPAEEKHISDKDSSSDEEVESSVDPPAPKTSETKESTIDEPKDITMEQEKPASNVDGSLQGSSLKEANIPKPSDSSSTESDSQPASPVDMDSIQESQESKTDSVEVEQLSSTTPSQELEQDKDLVESSSTEKDTSSSVDSVIHVKPAPKDTVDTSSIAPKDTVEISSIASDSCSDSSDDQDIARPEDVIDDGFVELNEKSQEKSQIEEPTVTDASPRSSRSSSISSHGKESVSMSSHSSAASLHSRETMSTDADQLDTFEGEGEYDDHAMIERREEFEIVGARDSVERVIGKPAEAVEEMVEKQEEKETEHMPATEVTDAKSQEVAGESEAVLAEQKSKDAEQFATGITGEMLPEQKSSDEDRSVSTSSSDDAAVSGDLEENKEGSPLDWSYPEGQGHIVGHGHNEGEGHIEGDPSGT